MSEKNKNKNNNNNNDKNNEVTTTTTTTTKTTIIIQTIITDNQLNKLNSKGSSLNLAYFFNIISLLYEKYCIY